MTQNTNNNSLEERILNNFCGAIENDLIHTIGIADEQLDELNTMTRSSYIDTADLKDALASTKDKFTVFSLNVQSINSKFILIYPLMLELNNADTAFSAIGLQESWLTDDSDLSQYQLPNYNLIHQGKQFSGHGGLLIYLHKRYSHVVRKLYDSSDFCISGANVSKNITLGNIYRPPKLNNNDLNISTFIEEFAPILSKLGNEKSETIITVDFNIDLLKVNDRPKVGDYFDLFCTNGFYPKITLPTRFSRDSCTLLYIDQIFCKCSTATITSTAGILMSSISDHLTYCITINNMQSKIRMTPNLVQIRVNNESSIKQYCESVGQSRIIEQLDVNITANPNSNYNILDDILHELHEKHFPTQKSAF